jgi:hypothetical protein
LTHSARRGGGAAGGGGTGGAGVVATGVSASLGGSAHTASGVGSPAVDTVATRLAAAALTGSPVPDVVATMFQRGPSQLSYFPPTAEAVLRQKPAIVETTGAPGGPGGPPLLYKCWARPYLRPPHRAILAPSAANLFRGMHWEPREGIVGDGESDANDAEKGEYDGDGDGDVDSVGDGEGDGDVDVDVGPGVLQFATKRTTLTPWLVLRNLRRLADSSMPGTGVARWKHLALRGAHKKVVVKAVSRAKDLWTSDGDGTSDKSVLLLGLKGLGKSFLLQSLVVGIQASLPPLERTKLCSSVQVVMVYSPTVRLENEELARTPRSLIASALQAHGLLHEDDGAIPAWAVEGLEVTRVVELSDWLAEKFLRVFLVVDEAESAWARSFSEAREFHDACMAFAEHMPHATLWLTGSTTKVRALAFGHLPHWTTPGAPGYGGDTALSLNDSKFRAINLFKQPKRAGARALVTAILRDTADDRVAPEYRRLKKVLLGATGAEVEGGGGGGKEAGEEDEEASGGAAAPSTAPPPAPGAAGGGGRTGDVGGVEEDEEDEEEEEEEEEDAAVEQLMWTAAGSTRDLVRILRGEVDDVAPSMRMTATWVDPKFRAVCKAIMLTLQARNGDAWNLRRKLWPYAELTEGIHVQSVDILNAPLDGPRADVERELLRTVTVEDLIGWDDLGILDVTTSKSGWAVGFRHPLFLLQAEAMDTAEASGLPWERRLALQVPMGPFVDTAETMVLEACASAEGVRAVLGMGFEGVRVAAGEVNWSSRVEWRGFARRLRVE